jgi:hypothetical protein
VAFNGNRFSQQKIFQDELPFAGNEWATANAACYLVEIDRLRSLFGFDDLIERFAAWRGYDDHATKAAAIVSTGHSLHRAAHPAEELRRNSAGRDVIKTAPAQFTQCDMQFTAVHTTL